MAALAAAERVLDVDGRHILGSILKADALAAQGEARSAATFYGAALASAQRLRAALNRITGVCEQFAPDYGGSIWQIILIANKALDGGTAESAAPELEPQPTEYRDVRDALMDAAEAIAAKDIGRAAAGGIIAVILANIVAYFLMRGLGRNLDS